MPFEIAVDDTARILRARYSGELAVDERIALARRVLDEARRTGIFHWLLDFRGAQASAADPAEAKRMADEFAPHLPDWTRMAYLLTYDHQLDDTVESLVRSQGVQVERFHDLEQAMTWLQAPGPAPAAAPAPGLGPEPERSGKDLRRALRLSAEATAGDALSPDQVASVGELVHELLAKGLDEASVLQLARRMSAAMRPPRA